MWVLERIANARLGCQVDDRLELVIAKKAFNGRSIGYVDFDEFEPLASVELPEPRLLQPLVIKFLEVVYSQHAKAGFKQLFAGMKSNKSGATRNQDPCHFDAVPFPRFPDNCLR